MHGKSHTVLPVPAPVPRRLQPTSARDSKIVDQTGSESEINVPVITNPAEQNEPSVAVHQLDPRIVVAAANDYREGPPRIGIYRSTDSGSTWSNFLPPLPPRHVSSGDPVVVYGYPDLFLVGGAAYKSPSGGEEEGGSIIVYRSTDAGATFGPPIIIMEGFNEQTFNDKPWFALDTAPASPFQGRAYVIYTRFMNPGTIILFQRSEDGGLTWSEPIPLTGIEPYSLGTFVTVGREGEVYVAWIRDNPEASFVFRRSLDGGRTFDEPVVVANFTTVEPLEGLRRFVPEFTFRVFTFGFLAADQTTGPCGGRLYAVWQQIRWYERHGRPRETFDIMLAYSDDRGETWSRPEKVTDTPNKEVSFFPFPTVSPRTGTLSIVYYTNRVVRRKLDVFLARAFRPGEAFPDVEVEGLNPDEEAVEESLRIRRRLCRTKVVPDQRVTNRSINVTQDPFAQEFIGDYIGASAKPSGSDVVAVWTDTRLGNEDIFANPEA